MATENLKVKITADASQAKAEIGKFKDTLKGTVQEGESATKSIGRMTAELGILLGTLKTVKSLVNNAIKVAAVGDAIKDDAQKVFMGTTAYQEWGYVLKQNGVEMSTLKVGMRKFAQEVANGSESLARYGITARDVDTAFGQAVTAIQNMGSETERIAAATELFGARALELMPVLNLSNAETQNLMMSYRALGGTMSNELIAASDVCTDSITAMKAAWSGLRNVLAAYVIPVVTKVVQWITIAIAYVRILLAAILGVKESFGGKGSKKTALPATTASVAKNTGGAAKNLKKASKHARELKRTLMGIDELTKLAEEATSAAAGGGSGGGGGGGSIGGIGGGDVGTFDGIISDETLQKIANFQDEVDKIKDKLHGAYEILKGLVEISLGNFRQGFTDLKNGITDVFPAIKDLKDKWNEIKSLIEGKILSAKAVLEDKVSSAWSTIKDVWEKAKNVKGTVTATIKLTLNNKFSKAWKKVKKSWTSIKSKTATITISFKNLIKSKWNALAKKINAAKAKAPAIIANILPSMPYLAKGGVLTAPTPAWLGEYAGAKSNPEIATPQSLMYETIQKANGDLVSAFATMTRQVIAAIENKDMTVRIGDEAIARSAQRGNSAYKSRTGKALLTI